jgi:hypothetical protein
MMIKLTLLPGQERRELKNGPAGYCMNKVNATRPDLPEYF